MVTDMKKVQMCSEVEEEARKKIILLMLSILYRLKDPLQSI
jgi:hypothetical protein